VLSTITKSVQIQRAVTLVYYNVDREDVRFEGVDWIYLAQDSEVGVQLDCTSAIHRLQEGGIVQHSC
jgi:hypothetical protein